MNTCPDCGSDIDADGDALDDGYDCGWTHPDDCKTCGQIYCDLSC